MAVEFARAAREHAAATGDANLIRGVESELAGYLTNTDGGLAEAQELLERALAERRESGDEMNVSSTRVLFAADGVALASAAADPGIALRILGAGRAA
ncbi:MAG: hypothetical protein ACXVY8_09920, partial [Gaiellaceae bacterium]